MLPATTTMSPYQQSKNVYQDQPDKNLADQQQVNQYQFHQLNWEVAAYLQQDPNLSNIHHPWTDMHHISQDIKFILSMIYTKLQLILTDLRSIRFQLLNKYLILVTVLLSLWLLFIPAWIWHLVPGLRYLKRQCPTEHKCYGIYGCFSSGDPFSHLPLPYSLQDMNITFNLMIKSAHNQYQLLSNESMLAHFDVNRDTKLVIHGFRGKKTHFVDMLCQSLVDQEKWNVIFVDWYGGGNLPFHKYFYAASNIRLVASVTAHWIYMLQDSMNYSSNNIHCIGISLGAHLCGFVGKHLITEERKPLKRITGLDPAGPGFNNQPMSGRLDSTDAEYVDVIHSDVNEPWYWFNYGIVESIGHVDIYLNAGIQPHCGIIHIWNQHNTVSGFISHWLGCSHMRSVELYIESLTSSTCKQRVIQCDSIQHALKGDCNSNSVVRQLLGELSIKSSGRGIFYTRTKDQPPFCVEP